MQQVPINHLQDKHPVLTHLWGIMLQVQPQLPKLLVLQEPIKQAQVNPRVTMLTLDTTFHPPANRARLHVLLEPSAVRPARTCVPALQQDTTCPLLVRRVRLHAVRGTIKHPPVKHPVMLLMQATMFLAQPKRARLLVLQEPTTRAPAHPVHQPAQMPMLDITFHLPANRARPLVW